MRKLTRRSYSRFNHFQEAIANGKPNDWRCRAGARYLYICEFGLVHYCSQQRGYPGVPLAEYKTRGRQARVPDRKGLRAELHHQLRAPGQLHRPLARAADVLESSAGRGHGRHTELRGAGADSLAGDAALAAAAQEEECKQQDDNEAEAAGPDVASA